MRILLICSVIAVMPIRLTAQSSSPSAKRFQVDQPLPTPLPVENIPPAASEQPQISSPHKRGGTDFILAAGYSRVDLTPNLPRGLTAHDANQPDDVRNPPFLTGFAGSTPIDHLTS